MFPIKALLLQPTKSICSQHRSFRSRCRLHRRRHRTDKWYQYPPFLHTSQYSFVSTSLSVLMFRRYHVRTDLMILQVPNQIALSRRQESSDDSPVCFWFLEQNRHRTKFLQTASLDFPESLFQSKISVFQDFPTVRDDSC